MRRHRLLLVVVATAVLICSQHASGATVIDNATAEDALQSSAILDRFVNVDLTAIDAASLPDPFGLGSAKMQQLLSLYSQYQSVQKRQSSGSANQHDVEILENIKSELNTLWTGASKEQQDKARGAYNAIVQQINRTLAQVRQQVKGQQTAAADDADSNHPASDENRNTASNNDSNANHLNDNTENSHEEDTSDSSESEHGTSSPDSSSIDLNDPALTLSPPIISPSRMMRQSPLGRLSSVSPLAMPLSSRDYLRMAGSSDLFELTSSRAVLAASPSPVVAAFAHRMIRDHSLMSQKMLLTASRLAGPGVPTATLLPKLDHEKATMMKMLLATPKEDRESVYLQQQLIAHQEGLQVHQTYARTGMNPMLVELAEAAIPILAQHLRAVQEILTQHS